MLMSRTVKAITEDHARDALDAQARAAGERLAEIEEAGHDQQPLTAPAESRQVRRARERRERKMRR